MIIQSLDDLKAIRDAQKVKVALRSSGDPAPDTIEITVGMDTCGLQAGARDTLRAMMEAIEAHDLHHVRLVKNGCMGHCEAEPTVLVQLPGQSPVLYGHVDSQRGRDIIEHHILGHHVLAEAIVLDTSDHDRRGR